MELFCLISEVTLLNDFGKNFCVDIRGYENMENFRKLTHAKINLAKINLRKN